jgi:hypothetical protein
MREIELTRGLKTIVDNDDYELLGKFRWIAHINDKGRIYASRRPRKKLGEPWGSGVIWMHRSILGESDLQVDHINGNTLDNRKKNLRWATPSENAHAMHRRKKLTDNPVGVGPVKTKNGKPWKATIMVRRERIYLGVFRTKLEASKAYQKKAIEAFGDFHFKL